MANPLKTLESSFHLPLERHFYMTHTVTYIPNQEPAYDQITNLFAFIDRDTEDYIR